MPRTLGHRIRSSVELCLELNGAREDVNSEEMLEARFCSYGDSVHCADTALRLAMAVSPPIENYLSSKKFDVGAELWTRSSSGFPGIRKPFNAFSCLSSGSQRVVARTPLFDGEPLGVASGITVWYVFNTFITYWYHRFQHRFLSRGECCIRCITAFHGSISPAP